MKDKIQLLEQKKLKELIDEYSELGYKTYADYKGLNKPSPIGGFVPDLLVEKGDKKIIIEIVTKNSLPNLKEKIEFLSRYVDKHENFRFDMVFTNLRTKSSKEETEISSKKLLSETQKRLLNEAEYLYSIGCYDASLLILCILLENLMNELVIKNKMDIDSKIPVKSLNNRLFDEKIISKYDFNLINNIIEKRNQITHKNAEINRNEMDSYVQFVSNFLKMLK